MSETLAVVLGIAGFMLVPAAIVAYIVLSGKKLNVALDQRVRDLTPSRTLVEAVIAPGGTVDLRGAAVLGMHKVWLECDVASATGRWTATATLAHRLSPPGAGYRDAAPEGGLTTEAPITFGEDGEGISTIGTLSVQRTGGLGIPRPDGRYWLQLMALPSCPEGTELFVRVGLSDLTSTQRASFRAFIGVSIA